MEYLIGRNEQPHAIALVYLFLKHVESARIGAQFWRVEYFSFTRQHGKAGEIIVFGRDNIERERGFIKRLAECRLIVDMAGIGAVDVAPAPERFVCVRGSPKADNAGIEFGKGVGKRIAGRSMMALAVRAGAVAGGTVEALQQREQFAYIVNDRGIGVHENIKIVGRVQKPVDFIFI